MRVSDSFGIDVSSLDIIVVAIGAFVVISIAVIVGSKVGKVTASSSIPAESIVADSIGDAVGAGVDGIIGVGVGDDVDIAMGAVVSFASNQSPASQAVIPTQQYSFSPSHTCVDAPFEQKVSGEQFA